MFIWVWHKCPTEKMQHVAHLCDLTASPVLLSETDPLTTKSR